MVRVSLLPNGGMEGTLARCVYRYRSLMRRQYTTLTFLIVVLWQGLFSPRDVARSDGYGKGGTRRI